MKNEALEQIKRRFGDRATDSPFERGLYSRDMAPVPALLVDPLFNTLPDLIVRPADADEVAEILKLAFANRIPVTPRAGRLHGLFQLGSGPRRHRDGPQPHQRGGGSGCIRDDGYGEGGNDLARTG